MHRIGILFFCFGWLPLHSGCGDAGIDATVEVTGRIFFRDQPLQDGTIAFISDPRANPHRDLAFSRIDSLGCYQLRTTEGKLPRPGVYQVAIVGSHRPGQRPATLDRPDPSSSQLSATISGPHHQVVNWHLP